LPCRPEASGQHKATIACTEIVNGNYLDMTGQKLILTLTLLLTFCSWTARKSNSEIAGNYYKYFTPGKDGYSEYFLHIKPDFTFTQKLVVHGIHGYKLNIIGNWKIEGDTVILVPTKVRSRKEPNAICRSENDNVFCRPDTLLVQNDALWSINPLYKEYERK
jgi:hypothetical protein